MTTWTNFANAQGAATTTWEYNPERGFMTQKRYANNTGPVYTQTPGGRAATRTWARGLVTTYGLDFGCTYNAANQRTGAQLTENGDHWVYAYDALGQVISGRKYTATQEPIAGCQFEYRFDDIGNRTGSAADAVGTVYEATPLNQYARRTTDGVAEVFSHDADGNLTNDARFAYVWDAENRLVEVIGQPGTTPRQRVINTYDWSGRRVRKQTEEWGVNGWVAREDLRFVYDGWNLVGILDGQLRLRYSFAWGTDMSGTAQGAGGVGGLWMMTDHTGTEVKRYYYAFDGNGNVSGLVDADSGAWAAQYTYGPFGEVVSVSGPMAGANPFRFSTKYQDDETGLVYYGHRFYDPSVGRWLSRDPIQEEGGLNLYGFVYNNPLGYYDYLGREGYWSDVGTTFQGMGQGALTVGKEVGSFAGDLLLGFVVVVTPDSCCNSLLTKLDDIGYKGSSLTAGAGGEYGGLKTGGKVFVAPVVAAVSVPVNLFYRRPKAALDGDLSAAGNYMGQALTTGGLLLVLLCYVESTLTSSNFLPQQ